MKKPGIVVYSPALAIGMSLICFCFVNAQEQTTAKLEAITPPDVLEQVNLVRMELEQLRAHMGRPKDHSEEIPVSDAEPREVFFQAVTLFRKANRMCFEHTRTRGTEPVSPDGTILPGHVYAAVDAALERVLQVKQQFGIDNQSKKKQSDPNKTPSDVFRSIVQANRQLNLLLEQRFSPSDVFQQVTVAIGYTERLIEQFPDVDSSVPDAPGYEPNKMPADVYRRLLGCFASVRQISEQSGMQVLELDQIDDADINNAAPSDVYDIASLVVSELAFIHGNLPDSLPPHKVYFPGRKFPSDVFQRAGILEKQLAQLQKLVQENPDWLNAADGVSK